MFRAKGRTMMLIGLIGVISLIIGFSTFISLAAEGPDKRPSYSITKPPQSMDQYYPPQSQAPVYLLQMFELEGAFSGIMANMQQGNFEAAQGAYQGFLAKYKELSEMVPEWKDYFDMELVEALGEALQSGDPGRIQQTMGGVGQTCGSCHRDNMLGTWYRYAWKDFHEISVQDPVSQQEVGWKDYMYMVAGDFGGIGGALQQGQAEGARMAYQSLSSRMEGLKKACENCHESERLYYVSEDVMEILDTMGAELTKEKPNPAQIGELSGQLGMVSCRGCHLVHMPAAMVQEAWKE